MAGPVVSVALREPLSDVEIDELGEWLRAIGDVERVERNPHGGLLGIANWDLRVTDLVAIAIGQPSAYGRSGTRPVLVGVHPTRDPSGLLYEHEVDEVAQWVAQVGYFPEHAIVLSAMCNRPIDHRILGQMALHLAERYGCIINLSGPFYPPRDVAGLPLWQQPAPPREGGTDADPLWVDPRIQPFVYRGPGRIFEFRYMAGEDRPWYSNAADVDAFRAALDDPRFRLIK